VHKFPDGIVLSGLLGSGGPMTKRSLYSVLAVLGMTPVGAILGAILLGHIPAYVLPFVLGCGAGTFLFVSASALLPEVMHMRPAKLTDVLWVLAGYVGFVLTESLLGGHSH